MKLQKQLSRKVNGVEYPKYVITIPPKKIKELGWNEGIELESKTNKGNLTISPIKGGN